MRKVIDDYLKTYLDVARLVNGGRSTYTSPCESWLQPMMCAHGQPNGKEQKAQAEGQNGGAHYGGQEGGIEQNPAA